MTNRDQIILDHLPQVEPLARRLHQRCPQAELNDLISAGTLGLIDAVDRFEPLRNLQLRTFAEHRIRGAMLDELAAILGIPVRQVVLWSRMIEASRTVPLETLPDSVRRKVT